MSMNTWISARELTEPRTCCRCGGEFMSASRELVCEGCRKPKTPVHLTFRESQVAHLVRQAKSNKEIAYELHLAEGTVKEYMNRIFHKLNVHTRTGLAILAHTQPERL